MQVIKIPEWFKRDLDKARFQDRAARIAAMPRVKILCGRDWGYGPTSYSFGAMWDKDPAPDEGAYIYRRRVVLHLTFRLTLEKI